MGADPLAEPGAEVMCVSALTGQGLPELIAEIGRRLVPIAPTHEGVPFTRRQIDLLSRARDSIAAFRADEAHAALAGVFFAVKTSS
jgi:hypothetical protein